MRQSGWTQLALAVLEREGLIQHGMVNIFNTEQGGYRMQVADHDNTVFELTVHTITEGTDD